MTKRLVQVLVLTLVLGAALAVSAGAASAHGGKRGGADKAQLLAAAAAYIGVTQAEIKTAKQAGQTLAQLATAKGKTVQGLTDALVTAGKASIDKAQADGKVTAAKATELKAALPAKVTAFVNATGTGCSHADAEKTGTSARRAGSPVVRRRG